MSSRKDLRFCPLFDAGFEAAGESTARGRRIEFYSLVDHRFGDKSYWCVLHVTAWSDNLEAAYRARDSYVFDVNL